MSSVVLANSNQWRTKSGNIRSGSRQTHEELFNILCYIKSKNVPEKLCVHFKVVEIGELVLYEI